MGQGQSMSASKASLRLQLYALHQYAADGTLIEHRNELKRFLAAGGNVNGRLKASVDPTRSTLWEKFMISASKGRDSHSPSTADDREEESSKIELLRCLLEAGAHPLKAPRDDFRGGLLSTLMGGRTLALRLIADYVDEHKLKAALNRYRDNKLGNSLLHFAAARNLADVVRLLLFEYGADPNARNNYGWTPRMCALNDSPALNEAFDLATGDHVGYVCQIQLPATEPVHRRSVSGRDVLVSTRSHQDHPFHIEGGVHIFPHGYSISIDKSAVKRIMETICDRERYLKYYERCETPAMFAEFVYKQLTDLPRDDPLFSAKKKKKRQQQREKDTPAAECACDKDSMNQRCKQIEAVFDDILNFYLERKQLRMSNLYGDKSLEGDDSEPSTPRVEEADEEDDEEDDSEAMSVVSDISALMRRKTNELGEVEDARQYWLDVEGRAKLIQLLLSKGCFKFDWEDNTRIVANTTDSQVEVQVLFEEHSDWHIVLRIPTQDTMAVAAAISATRSNWLPDSRLMRVRQRILRKRRKYLHSHCALIVRRQKMREMCSAAVSYADRQRLSLAQKLLARRGVSHLSGYRNELRRIIHALSNERAILKRVWKEFDRTAEIPSTSELFRGLSKEDVLYVTEKEETSAAAAEVPEARMQQPSHRPWRPRHASADDSLLTDVTTTTSDTSSSAIDDVANTLASLYIDFEEGVDKVAKTEQTSRTLQTTRTTPWQCNVCHKYFASKCNLAVHMALHEPDARKFVCEVCGHRFAKKQNLVTHSRTHTGEKPFKCEQCGKGFARRNNLQRHLRSHLSVKPFACPCCPRRFSAKDSLRVHLRLHYPGKLKCPHCPRQYVRPSYLRQHATQQHSDQSADIESDISAAVDAHSARVRVFVDQKMSELGSPQRAVSTPPRDVAASSVSFVRAPSPPMSESGSTLVSPVTTPKHGALLEGRSTAEVEALANTLQLTAEQRHKLQSLVTQANVLPSALLPLMREPGLGGTPTFSNVTTTGSITLDNVPAGLTGLSTQPNTATSSSLREVPTVSIPPQSSIPTVGDMSDKSFAVPGSLASLAPLDQSAPATTSLLELPTLVSLESEAIAAPAYQLPPLSSDPPAPMGSDPLVAQLDPFGADPLDSILSEPLFLGGSIESHDYLGGGSLDLPPLGFQTSFGGTGLHDDFAFAMPSASAPFLE
ncbi:MAG: hypothetical protein MHM6MM_001739 [Cercozoa sp. M6MM]